MRAHLQTRGIVYKFQTHSTTVACLFPPACHNIFAMAVISALWRSDDIGVNILWKTEQQIKVKAYLEH